MAKKIGLEQVVCKNPKTGQVLTTTAKVFHSIYVDKGFELLSRQNVDHDDREDRPRKNSRSREPRSEELSSARDIANRLGIDPNAGPGEPEKGNFAASIGADDLPGMPPSATPVPAVPTGRTMPEGEADNVDLHADADIDDTDSAPRPANRRDRGRSS